MAVGYSRYYYLYLFHTARMNTDFKSSEDDRKLFFNRNYRIYIGAATSLENLLGDDDC